MCISIIKENTITEIIKIIILLVTAASIMPKVTSNADKGAINVSIIFPWIFAIIKELTEWLNPCWIIDIAINPGAKKLINEYPNTSPLSDPRARVKTDKNRRLETKGDRRVWAQTIKNLLNIQLAFH